MDDEKKILDEIRAMLSHSQSSSNLKGMAKGDKNKKLSRTASMPGQSPYYNKEHSKKESLKIEKVKRKPPKPDAEDLVNFYSSQGIPKSDKNAIIMKQIQLPYQDGMMKVAEGVKVEDRYFVDKIKENPTLMNKRMLSYDGGMSINSKSDDVSVAVSEVQINAAYLKNRFPRFTSGFHFTDAEVDKVALRSDLWMTKFMEECYDEALSACDKEINVARRRKRCGLDLGSLDSFPQVIQRYITRSYSVLEMRTTVSLELLITIIHYIRKEAGNIDDNSCLQAINGHRAELFAKLLSEEYDVDFLAMFLHVRDVLQRTFSIKLRDVNQQGIWITSVPDINKGGIESLLPSSPFTIQENRDPTTIDFLRCPVAAIKIVPVQLPTSLKFVPDYTMPEAPLISFDIHLLARLVSQILPKTTPQKIRTYLAHSILKRFTKLHGAYTSNNNSNKQG